MDMPDKADIVVVGAGVIGLSCAWRLRQRGLGVTVMEWRTCGSGASGAALGVLMPAPATRRGPFQRLQRQSLGEFPAFAAALTARTGIDVGYRRCGLVEVLHGEGRRQQAVGETRIACAEWPPVGTEAVMAVLDGPAARDLEPHIEFQAFGARWCHATANVDVAQLIGALRAACLADGVEILEGSAVREVAVREGRARGVVLGEGDFEAGAVLVAAGAWTGQLGESLSKHAAMRPVRGQAMLLRAPGVRISRIIKQQGIYLIPRDDGMLMLGATTEPESGFSARPTAHGIAELTQAGLALAPGLADAEVIDTWAGLRPESLDGHPVLGAVPGVAGLYVAAGHYKTGIGLAALTSRAMAELIADGTSTVDLAAFSPRAGAA